MGMSASQARLIALTARMNDIEYQGQQINQQRTTLSSQVNALYNSLLDMDVPTPPSTIDYQKTVYSGITGATNFTMSNVVPTGRNEAGNNTYSIDMSYQMTGHSVSPSSLSVNITHAEQYLYFNEVDQSCYMTNPSRRYYEPTTQSNLAANDTQNPTANDVLVKMENSQYISLMSGVTPSSIYTADGTNGLKEITSTELTDLDNNAYIYVQLNSEDILGSQALRGYCGNLPANPSVTDGNYDLGVATLNVYSASLTETNPVYQGYKTDSQISALNLYAVNNSSSEDEYFRITTVADLQTYLSQGFQICQPGTSDTGIQIDNPNYNPDAQNTGLTVGNMVVYNMSDDEVKQMLGQASYADYLEALSNSFPALDEQTIADYFYVYVETLSSGQMKPHFILKTDLGVTSRDVISAKTYEYDEDGTYTSTEKTDDCELEFDASTGRIARLGIPDGNGQVIWIDITASTETDQEAYNEAFNNYEYEKVKYDREQQLINQKTSIIQAEDKSLELKLTRLDNERNAVNTEIEAVQKVVDDNIEKSFKTFSG